MVKPGMVLAVECWMFETGENFQPPFNVYGGEDYVYVTEDGCDIFPAFPTDIVSLGA